MFLRGEPVIINDFDEPSNRLIAIIMRWDAKQGAWRARYLSDYPRMLYCWTSYEPTRLADFGVDLEFDSVGCFRTVPNGQPSTAVYRDGKPRQWQQRGREWWPSRDAARRLYFDFLNRQRAA